MAGISPYSKVSSLVQILTLPGEMAQGLGVCAAFLDDPRRLRATRTQLQLQASDALFWPLRGLRKSTDTLTFVL